MRQPSPWQACWPWGCPEPQAAAPGVAAGAAGQELPPKGRRSLRELATCTPGSFQEEGGDATSWKEPQPHAAAGQAAWMAATGRSCRLRQAPGRTVPSLAGQRPPGMGRTPGPWAQRRGTAGGGGGGWRGTQGCQPWPQAGRRVLPPVPTGWQQPPAAPAGHQPHSPPHRARCGARLCPGPQPSSTAGTPAPAPSPAYGAVFQPEGWKKRKVSALLLPRALAAVGSPRDPLTSSGVTLGPPRQPHCQAVLMLPSHPVRGKARLPFPPVGLSPSATTGRGEEAPRKQSSASTSATERGDTPVAACGSPLIWEFAWLQHQPRAVGHSHPQPGPPASATSAGGAESWPVPWIDTK